MPVEYRTVHGTVPDKDKLGTSCQVQGKVRVRDHSIEFYLTMVSKGQAVLIANYPKGDSRISDALSSFNVFCKGVLKQNSVAETHGVTIVFTTSKFKLSLRDLLKRIDTILETIELALQNSI